MASKYEDNLSLDYFRLRSGNILPSLGYGCNKTNSNLVFSALQNGCRLLDTAKVYGTEKSVGLGIQHYLKLNQNIRRKDIFVISKLWNDDHERYVQTNKSNIFLSFNVSKPSYKIIKCI